jgi:signal recognition particle receptor subunit alpha
MLESLTIFTPGGVVLYQYTAHPSLFQASAANGGAAAHSNAVLNKWIGSILLKTTRRQQPSGNSGNKNTTTATAQKTFAILENGITVCWLMPPGAAQDYTLVAVYPDILFEGPRLYLKTWAENLLQETAREFALCYTRTAAQGDSDNNSLFEVAPFEVAPFDGTFRVLLEHSKSQKQQLPPAGEATTATKATANSAAAAAATAGAGQPKNSGNKGKEMRHWGDAKVTEQAMNALDMSSEGKDKEGNKQLAYERALREAREAYLPNPEEVAQNENSDFLELSPNGNSHNDGDGTSSSSSWSATVTGLFQQITGQRVLTASDLERPLQQMETLLKQKNVASSIAQALCQAVQEQLVGRKLNSLYRIQTAVQQALEGRLETLLTTNVDLLRNVLSKRGSSAFSLASLRGGSGRRPYVISVMGINGIGKTTTLAKLAYYFQHHGCQPLLVAGDTFRSGAVEQLQVHADCLNVPLFSQGYSKDPSAVAAAAIAQATANGNDVVLVDTAGRMQNNVPLMKALGKLVEENRPDFCILVCEALVGHDGLDQFRMFKSAARIDGLILTKFDTIDQKMGASLTLTHETGCPIVFLGVGQKYHHLKKLQVKTVVQSLLA